MPSARPATKLHSPTQPHWSSNFRGCYGDTVTVDADGFEVESYFPGGAKLKLSGTSIATPNVSNLAAKLFALDPSLTSAQVIELIRQGATANEADAILSTKSVPFALLQERATK